MSDETQFRFALLLVFLITMTVVVYHRLQAARGGDRISRREEGIPLAVILRLTGLLWWLATMAYLIHPQWMAWARVELPDWLRWIGVMLGLSSGALMYWTLSNLGRNLTDTVITRASASLVTIGPYRWVRHPFYVVVLLLTLSSTLISAHWCIGLLGLSIFILLAIRTPIEERKLVEKFGPQYEAYMRETGRFFPR